VVSAIELTPAPMPPLVAVAGRRVEQPPAVRVRVHGTGATGEEVAVLPAGSSSEALVSRPVGGDLDRTMSFATDDIPPGAYGVALLSAEGQVVARTPFWVVPPGADPAVSTAKRRYEQGEAIEVSWANALGMRYDWLAIFKERTRTAPPQESCSAGVCGNGRYLLYEYTGAEIQGSTVFSSDSIVGYARWPLAPGRYEVRLLLDDGYRSVATSAPFEIRASESTAP
jgi:hypothetical protein